MTPVPIVDTLGRTAEGNGVSRPYKCLGADGSLYFVKTAAMGIEQMVKDWLGCSLAARMRLPVAPVAFVDVPEALAEGQAELSPGIAFGSREVTQAIPFTPSHARGIDPALAGRILLFDWFTQNEDRKASLLGGNSNLLFVPHEQRLVMIDEDNAFDSAFDSRAFWELHGLAEHRTAFLPGLRDRMQDWLLQGLSELPTLWKELPEAWLVTPDGEPRIPLDSAKILAMLGRFQADPEAFWNSPWMQR